MAYDLCSSRQCNICLLFPTRAKNDKSISSGSLFKCNGCFLVVYCGEEHQKKDWPLHRNLCRAVKSILTAFNSEHPLELEKKPTNVEDIERSIALLKHSLRITLRRELNFYEEELTSFPTYCALCFCVKNLKRCCRSCYAVSYCSQEHEEKHKERHQISCNLLRIYYCKFKVTVKKNFTFKGFVLRVPKLQNTDLIDAIQYSTKLTIPPDPTFDFASYQNFSFVSDFSSIATICYSLEYVNMSNFENKEFRIFVVGATIEKQLWFQAVHTRFFFLQYSKIENLSVYFVGPETKDNSGSQSQSYHYLGKKRTVNYITYKGLFQDFIHSCVILPSLIVAFNCGFSEHTPTYPKVVSENILSNRFHPEITWPGGLREILLTHDVPFLFTSYTKMEADNDFAELVRASENGAKDSCIGINRILKCSQNPYRDMRPLRNWQTTDEEEIYYRNNYLQLVKTNVKK